LTGG
jgi:hypothetical protein